MCSLLKVSHQFYGVADRELIQAVVACNIHSSSALMHGFDVFVLISILGYFILLHFNEKYCTIHLLG